MPPPVVIEPVNRYPMSVITREAQRVRSLTDHFDWLVREAKVDARHVADHIDALPRK